MGAQINLFYKFTRKPGIGVEEVFVGWCDRGAGGWEGSFKVGSLGRGGMSEAA